MMYLENHIGEIINRVRTSIDSFMIVTSREEVFKKFHPVDETNLQRWEKRLNPKISPYNFDKRKQMVHEYAKATDCNWIIENENLRNSVFNYLENKDRLSSPLSIRDFVIAVKAENTKDMKKISVIDR